MKKLIGEDWIAAEFKGKDGFMFKNYSKLLFSTNMLPVITTERYERHLREIEERLALSGKKNLVFRSMAQGF